MNILMKRCSLAVILFSMLLASTATGQTVELSGASDLKILQTRLGNALPITWVFTGDSITHGCFHTHVGYRSYLELFAERLRWEMRRFRDIVINTGISGQTTKLLLPDWNWCVQRFKPDVVSVMLAGNDCLNGTPGRHAFRDNLRTMVKMIRKANAIPILHTPNPISIKNPDPRRTDLPAYAEIVREVARDMDCICVDHYAHWLKAKPKPDDLEKWLNDPLHPGVVGHRELAKEMFRTLSIFDDKSPTCKLE